MTHDNYRELIQRELDGDLSPDETAMLDRHTISCAACRTERDEYSRLAVGLMSMKTIRPERSFVSQMELDFDEFLRPQPQQPLPLKKKVLPRIPAAWWQGLSVAAVVVLAIGITSNFLPGTPSKTAQPGPAVVQSVPGTVAGTNQPTQPVEQPAPVAVAPTSTEPQNGAAPTPSAADAKTSASGTKTPAGMTSGAGTASAGAKPAAGTVVADASKPDTSAMPSTPVVSDPTAPQADDNDEVAAAEDDPTDGSLIALGPVVEKNAISHLKERDTFYGVTAGALAAEQPPLPMIVGPLDRVPTELTGDLQAKVNAGDESARWATVPTQVVQRVLTEIGFAAIATVHETNQVDRVDVEQAGQRFRVRLVQPYETGENGIWHPVQISRELSMTSTEPTDQPVIAFFERLRQGFGVTIVSLHVEENLKMNRTVIGADLIVPTDDGPRRTYYAYSFHLKLNPDYKWTLNGDPVILR